MPYYLYSSVDEFYSLLWAPLVHVTVAYVRQRTGDAPLVRCLSGQVDGERLFCVLDHLGNRFQKYMFVLHNRKCLIIFKGI